MSGNVAELKQYVQGDTLAKSIVNLYTTWDNQRQGWKSETKEVRDYVYATDSTAMREGKIDSTNGPSSWANTTHVPKLCQIYDNLKANYMSALFPNDDWLEWLAGSSDAASQEKRKAILAYMQNKLREDNFYTTVSGLIDDYILNGNPIADVEYVRETTEDPLTGEIIAGYIGPRVIRIQANDIVINPLARTFKSAPKVTRSIMSLGELKQMVDEQPENQGWVKEAISEAEEFRTKSATFNTRDWEKVDSMEIDGFGSFYQYLQGPYVELLEFEGDWHDVNTGEYHKNKIITVMDRCKIVRDTTNPSWMGNSLKVHAGWRERPDNLWAMSPLANVVGMQYRINHLENAKADAIDLNILPPIKVVGEVEDFEWGPYQVIQTDENGDVGLLSPDLSALNVDSEIQFLMNQMELFTGAPREAMGVRTAGEKTAFEVQTLANAASRIFQEKIRNFEINLLEPLLNNMLEVARRNIDGSDIVRVMDDDIGVESFLQITKEDITAAGKLRPVGARHFARQAQLMQNLVGITNSGVWQMISPHVSRKQMTKVAEDLLGLERFALFGENIGLMEDAETAQVGQQLQQEMGMTAEQQMVEEEVAVGPTAV